METAILIAQLAATGLIAAWLATGVYDNIRYPYLNETYTAEVLSMSQMKEQFPADFAFVAHRAIHNRTIQLWAFRIVVIAELIACLLLWAGVVALLMAVVGTAAPDTARSIALLGATAFTCVWGGFLVVGNYFSYWYCHDGAQNTHYQMTLWGIGTMILLAAA